MSAEGARRRLGVAAVALVGALLGGTGLASAATPAEPASAADLVPGTPCTTAASACVDLDSRTAWLIEDGEVRRTVPFLGGDAITPTPTGTFRVEWKAREYHSREYDVDMPFSVFFAPDGIAFHEGSLTESSAGCVHLRRPDAAAFFDRLQVGDEVQVRGTRGRQAAAGFAPCRGGQGEVRPVAV